MAFGRVGALGTGFGRLGTGERVGGLAGGASLLATEVNGFAADFTWPVDAQRVAVKTAGAVVSSGTSFFTNSSASVKWVYNSSGTLTSVAAGSLAVDYNPTTLAARGLLIEAAATNTVLRCSEFDNATWTKNSLTVTANAIAAPNGLTEADAFIPAAGSVSPFVTQAAVLTTDAVANTLSFYAKNGTLGTPWLEILQLSGATREAWFNLATGVKGTTAGGVTSTNMVALPNGWYRCDMTFTAGSAGSALYIAVRDADGSGGGVTGDGVKPCFYVWGAQMEVGTVPTSPIPTAAAAVTRAVDNVTCTTAAMGAGWSAAGSNSLVINAAPNVISSAIYLNMHDGTDNERYVLDTSTGTKKGRLFTADGNVTQTDLGAASVPVAGTYYKTAFAMATNDFALSTDGGTIQTDAVGTLPTVTTLTLGGPRSTGGRNVHIKTIMTVPRRMTNPQLVTAST